MKTHPHVDAAFFDMIHSLLDAQSTDENRERRGDRRHPYRHVQLMAPYDGHELPLQADFRPVQCHDLSPNGFSFHAPGPPDFDHIVIALGTVPFTFFSAEVVHVHEAPGGSVPQYLVGCRFVRRIEE